MSAGRLCIREVHLADPDETIREAASRMREHHVGTLMVLDASRRPIGIVTDRDLVVRALASNQPIRELRVADVMSRPVVTVSEPTSIQDALAVMRSAHHRRLAVVDGDGRLAGILSVDDVVELLGTEFYRIRDVLAVGPTGP